MISLLSITLFIVLMFIGVPVSASLVLATILCMVAGGYDLILMPQHMGSSVESIELLAIPFFILAADLMKALGMTRYLRFRRSRCREDARRPGTCQRRCRLDLLRIIGAAVADAAALGAISMKEMPRVGYGRVRGRRRDVGVDARARSFRPAS